MSSIYIIMGVSGSGKSTVGAMLANELAIPFYDADDFHPAVNIAKMRRGQPLNDKDRQPWLLSLHTLLVNHKDEGAVLACSALKQSYRKTLQVDLNINWVHLEGSFALIQARMQERAHFMPASLLQSQFDALEPLNSGLVLDISEDAQALVKKIRANYETTAVAEWGIVGMGVMGKSLALNAVNKGVATAVYNRTTAAEEHIIHHFIAEHPNPKLSGFTDWQEFMGHIASPRIILLMIPAGAAIDQVLLQMDDYLNPGDCIIDGGNSNFKDSERRVSQLKDKGIEFLGMGVSGGEEGALKGPAMMPGGSLKAYETTAPLLRKLAAKDSQGDACFGYLGGGGSGHLVKTVHNGIEYAEMQLLAELYSMLEISDLPREELGRVFENWNKGEFSSYLLGIMPAIVNKKEGDNYLIDKITDQAAHKGTGAWTAQTALEHGQDAGIIIAALNARYHSTAGWFRYLPTNQQKTRSKVKLDMQQLINGYQAARILNHLQGLRLIKAVSDANKWSINMAEVCRIWTNGCIIKSTLIEQLYKLLSADESLEGWSFKQYKKRLEAFRYTLNTGWQNDLHLPALNAAWQYGLGISSKTTNANIIQAQRDYFGAHTYKRKDADPSKNFHTDWKKP